MDQTYRHEKPLFAISLIISIFAWLGIIGGTMGMALGYILIFYLFYLFTHSGFIAYIKGTAIRIDEVQFPDLFVHLKESCRILGMDKIPETYLLQGGGLLNAFATRFLRRNYLILLADTVDAFTKKPEAIRFYLGHELGHIRQKHLIWGPILLPSSIMPLLGTAYSRAREYTCDSCGLACCLQAEDAMFGLGALAAGQKRWATMRYDRFMDQSRETGGFWMSFHELTSDYPWLVKRMTRMSAQRNRMQPNFPDRHILAWLLALFIPRGGGGGAPAAMMTIAAIIGILVAIAIPQFERFQQRTLQQTENSDFSMEYGETQRDEELRDDSFMVQKNEGNQTKEEAAKQATTKNNSSSGKTQKLNGRKPE